VVVGDGLGVVGDGSGVLGDGSGLAGLDEGGGVSVVVGLTEVLGLADGLAEVLALDEGLALRVGTGLDVELASRSSAPDSDSVLAVCAGRAPHRDAELADERSRVPARATPYMLHERIDRPANVLSAIDPARRSLTGTAAPGVDAPAGACWFAMASGYACPAKDSPLSLFDTWARSGGNGSRP
jgi:hypothetical protein